MTTLRIETAPIFEPLLHPSRYKGIHGGRGGGKSHFFAELMIEGHISEKRDSVCLREVQKSLKFSSKKLLESKIDSMNAGAYFEVQDAVIKAANGGIITFIGMNDQTADSIKSLEGFKISWFEEAQSASQRSLDLLRPTMRSNSELWFSWNPFKEGDAIEVLLRGENPPKNSIIVEANYYDNPWLPQDLIDEMEIDRLGNQDKFNNIWHGKFLKNSDGDYYKNEMAKARADGRILSIPKLDIPVNVFWDIGNFDGCAAWFHQRVGLEHRFIRYYEAHGETLAHYAKHLQSLGYLYGKHYFPHDAAHKRLSDTNKSVKEMMEDLGLKNIEIVPRITELNTGIAMTRAHFPSVFIDKDDCKLGIQRMDNYRKKYNRTDNRWVDEPDKNNGCSEGADAFRQWAQALEGGMLGGMVKQQSRRKPGSWRTL